MDAHKSRVSHHDDLALILSMFNMHVFAHETTLKIMWGMLQFHLSGFVPLSTRQTAMNAQ